MKAKKMLSVLLIMGIVGMATACGSTSNTKENNTSKVKDETSVTTVETPSTTILEETTTEIKEEPKKNRTKSYHLIGDEWYEYLLDYKEVIIKNFDGKVFNPGDVINVRDEILNASYDLEEYEKVFSAMHLFIKSSLNYSFSTIELTSEYAEYPLVDETNNFVYSVDEEDPFTVNVKFDDYGNMELSLTTY